MNFEIINNVKCYAPDLALLNDHYPKETFSIVYNLESNNFWSKSRNKIIANVVQKYLHAPEAKFIEICCGTTGFVLEKFTETMPHCSVSEAEIHLEDINFAKKSLPNVEFLHF